MLTGDNEKDEKILFLPHPHRQTSLGERADAYRRLAVMHKMSIPDKWERISSREKARKELENSDPLNVCKDIAGLENEIKETKDAIHGIKRKIRMFEKDGDENEDKEKKRLAAEKKSKQERLNIVKKFADIESDELGDDVQRIRREIEELETKISAFKKNGYREKIRLEEEKENTQDKLKTLETFLTKVSDIVKWQVSLAESKEAILCAWAFEQNQKKVDWIIRFHAGLKEIEAQ